MPNLKQLLGWGKKDEIKLVPKPIKQPKPRYGDMRVVEKWNRAKNGAPVRRFVVEKYMLIFRPEFGGSLVSWEKVQEFKSEKRAKLFLENLKNPLPEDKVLSAETLKA